MTGAHSGDAEDLLGQFLAHRGTPTHARTRTAAPSPEADETPAASPDEPSFEAPVEPALEEDRAEDEPVQPVAVEPARTPVSDTMAHAGAILEAFASGTLELDEQGELDFDAPDAPAAEPPAVQPERSPANDAGHAILAAMRSEPAPVSDTDATHDDASAFEELAVASPLERDPVPAPRIPPGPAEPDGRPDSTAASASVFAAFQEQLSRDQLAHEQPVASPAEAPHLEAPRVEAPRAAAPAPSPVEPDEEIVDIAPPTTRSQAPGPARRAVPKPEPRVTAPRLPAATPAPAPEPTTPAVPHEVVFRPRRVARTLVALILLVFIAASALACWWAYRDRTLVPVGIAATILIATGLIWATRAGSSVAHLSVKGGRLEITKDGTRTVFDLTSQYTVIDVQGTPGRRGWKVLFERRGLPPYVVDASMVSPAEFTRVLEFYRPHQRRTPND